MSAIILDTETTDVEDNDVIELAWESYPRNEKITRWCGRYSTDKPIRWGALAVHNILPSDLVGLPPASRAPDDVPIVDYWIGHNIDFDWKALGSPSSVRRIDTLAMCRDLWPEVDSHKLTAMIYYTQGANEVTRKKVLRAHSAMDDVEMCWELLGTICEVAKLDPRDLEALWEYSEAARIPKMWTFGKFKGQPIAAADRGYANWCRKQPDFDPYVLEALRRAGL